MENKKEHCAALVRKTSISGDVSYSICIDDYCKLLVGFSDESKAIEVFNEHVNNFKKFRGTYTKDIVCDIKWEDEIGGDVEFKEE